MCFERLRIVPQMRPNQGAVPNFNFGGPRDAHGGALRHDSRHGDGHRLSGGCVEAFEWAGHARDTCKPDGAERAVHSGLALVEEVGNLSARFNLTLQARIGIATGLVVVGDLVREGAAQEFAAFGETPNLAARLQVFAQPDTAVISAAKRRLSGGLFEYRDLGRVGPRVARKDLRLVYGGL